MGLLLVTERNFVENGGFMLVMLFWESVNQSCDFH